MGVVICLNVSVGIYCYKTLIIIHIYKCTYYLDNAHIATQPKIIYNPLCPERYYIVVIKRPVYHAYHHEFTTIIKNKLEILTYMNYNIILYAKKHKIASRTLQYFSTNIEKLDR